MPAPSSRSAHFETWLAARAPRETWATLNLPDLELCWLSLEGDALALAELERRLERVARAVVGTRDEDRFQEVLQRVRERLLVGPRPRLAAYQGTGALVPYLRAVVASVSVDLSRRSRGSRPADEGALLAAATVSDGAEAQLAQHAHRRDFTEAFKQALEALTAEERTWLRLRFLDGLSIDAVGAAFGVHRTTAMRRLEKTQAALMTETRRLLAARLKLSLRGADSLMQAMRPSLAERLSRLLRREG